MTAIRSDAAKNAALNAELALLNTGELHIFTAGAAVLLSEHNYSATAFGSASGGSASANAISSDSSANASGDAALFRSFANGGVTQHREGKVTQVVDPLATISATATGFDDSADGAFAQAEVGDSINLTGFTNSAIDGDYIVLTKADDGTIATCPVPPAVESAGQSITVKIGEMQFDNITFVETGTVNITSQVVTGQ